MLVLTKDSETGQVVGASAYGENARLDEAGVKRIYNIINSDTIATYNGVRYDLPILTIMLARKTCAEVNGMSNAIIKQNKMGWALLKQVGLYQVQPQSHIDAMAICPALRISLKSAGARLHSKRIIDLPIAPESHVTREEADVLTRYCRNDLDITLDLCRHMSDRIESRQQMKLTDATAKSDAQIAEYYMKKYGGVKPPHNPPHDFFKREFELITPPDMIFANKDAQFMYDVLQGRPFKVGRDGRVDLPGGWFPKNPDGTNTTVGTVPYDNLTLKLGIGGLHSQESGVHAEDVFSYDVVSYYPRIILNMGFEPEGFNGDFLKVYNQLYRQRVEAKKAGDKAKSEALKIVINGTFGKFGSPWSVIYDPLLMLSVTLSGQLYLMHLVDKCFQEGIKVISVNTDGIVCDRDASEVIREWEFEHDFEIECTRYVGYWGRDVNNYCALGVDGKWKDKGIFVANEITKSPHAAASSLAAKAYFVDGTPVDRTIAECNDIREFIIARAAKGGCEWRGQRLGRMARWYWALDGSDITYISSGYKVAGSDNAHAIMSLPHNNACPDNVDREAYSNYAWEIVESIMGE